MTHHKGASATAKGGGGVGGTTFPTMELSKFDMNSIKSSHCPTVAIIGRRETGKTVLAQDILSHHQDVPCKTVISTCDEFASNDNLQVHTEFKLDIIEQVLRRQRNSNKRTIVVMDNCFYNHSWSKDKFMRLLFLNKRQWKIMLIITMSFPLIPPILRKTIDYTFIFREKSRRVYEDYAGMFPTYELFCQTMDQYTGDYNCLVIDNTVKSTNLEDRVFWYKAELKANSLYQCIMDDTIVIADMPSYGSTPLEKQVLSLAQEIIVRKRPNRHYNVSKFELSQIKCNSDDFILIIGRRDVGKTFLLNHIVQSLNIDVIRFNPETHVDLDGYCYDILSQPKQTIRYATFDDCVYDPNQFNEKPLKSILHDPQRWNIMPIVAVQHPAFVAPNVRYVFIMKDDNVGNRKQLYELYGGMFSTFEQFNFIMTECTKDYECLVIDNNPALTKLEDMVFWYKAE